MRAIGRPLHAGEASGAVVKLDEPLSFWGGLDPGTGRVIDESHPQLGSRLTGRIVVMPGSRGSSGTPGTLAESLRRDTGPAGLIVSKPDINLMAGAAVAERLYGRSCPVVLVDAEDLAAIVDREIVSIEVDGTVVHGEIL